MWAAVYRNVGVDSARIIYTWAFKCLRLQTACLLKANYVLPKDGHFVLSKSGIDRGETMELRTCVLKNCRQTDGFLSLYMRHVCNNQLPINSLFHAVTFMVRSIFKANKGNMNAYLPSRLHFHSYFRYRSFSI